MKRITVRYFAMFREHAGVGEETLELDATTARDLCAVHCSALSDTGRSACFDSQFACCRGVRFASLWVSVACHDGMPLLSAPLSQPSVDRSCILISLTIVDQTQLSFEPGRKLWHW